LLVAAVVVEAVAAAVVGVVAAAVSAAEDSVVVDPGARDLGLVWVWAIPITDTADTIPIMVTRAFAMSSGDVS